MELDDVKKICLNCMTVSEDSEICPMCKKDKRGLRTFGRALEPGTILNGKIVIGNILGMGNFGITYIGFDMLLEYKVAVKEFFPDDLVEREEDGSLSVVSIDKEEEYQEEKKDYQREARILAQFSKFPGIVSIKELFYENNTAYMVMEYLEGGTLRRYIDSHSGKIPIAEALELMEPVICSMETIHESGLIHRDISPENIMFDTDGSIKVIDFGASKKVANSTAQIYFGKFGYAPIEQMMGEGQGNWTDVYGICATLYCMVTGDIPQDAFERNLEDEIIDIASYGLGIDDKTAKAIMKGLSMNAQDRQQSMGQLHLELYGVLPGEEMPKTGENIQEEKKERSFTMVQDKRGRIWFGSYPMNEVIGSKLTTDIVYADYEYYDTAVAAGKRYRKLSSRKMQTSKEFFGTSKMKGKEENRVPRFFDYCAIPWIVLARNGNKLLLQSEYVIDFMAYDSTDYLNCSEREIAKVKRGISWEQSRIREWLNTDFYREAFSEEEKKKILIREVKTPISSFNDQFTYDRIYLPSAEEALHKDKPGEKTTKHKIQYSQYAAAKKNDDLSPMGYGLRTRGTISNENAVYAYGEGFEGHSVYDDGLHGWRLDFCMGIKPVIYVDASDLVELI